MKFSTIFGLPKCMRTKFRSQLWIECIQIIYTYDKPATKKRPLISQTSGEPPSPCKLYLIHYIHYQSKIWSTHPFFIQNTIFRTKFLNIFIGQSSEFQCCSWHLLSKNRFFHTNSNVDSYKHLQNVSRFPARSIEDLVCYCQKKWENNLQSFIPICEREVDPKNGILYDMRLGAPNVLLVVSISSNDDLMIHKWVRKNING